MQAGSASHYKPEEKRSLDDPWGVVHQPALRKLRLEANILEFAHILFATANTTARLGQLAP